MNNACGRSEGYIKNEGPSCPGNIFSFISAKEGGILREITKVGIFLFDTRNNSYMFPIGLKEKTFFKDCVISTSGTVLGNRLTGEIIVVHGNKECDEYQNRSGESS